MSIIRGRDARRIGSGRLQIERERERDVRERDPRDFREREHEIRDYRDSRGRYDDERRGVGYSDRYRRDGDERRGDWREDRAERRDERDQRSYGRVYYLFIKCQLQSIENIQDIPHTHTLIYKYMYVFEVILHIRVQLRLHNVK